MTKRPVHIGVAVAEALDALPGGPYRHDMRRPEYIAAERCVREAATKLRQALAHLRGVPVRTSGHVTAALIHADDAAELLLRVESEER